MSGRYTQAYSDKTHFSVPADAQEYSDDPNHQNGNGIYNDYTVDLQPKEYSSSFNIACFRFTNTRRSKCMLFGGLVAFCVLLIVIIAIASSSRKDSGGNPTWVVKGVGLVAYGPDANGRIDFNPTVSSSYIQYVNNIEAAMADYSTVHQYGSHEIFVPCNESTTSLPEGKVCQFTGHRFGQSCQNINLYGMKQGRPCVLLVLKLPKGVNPVPLNFTHGQNNDVFSKLHERASSDAVHINCEGKTEADESQIIKDKHTGPFIDYQPPKGFAMYSFLGRDRSNYVWPAVMVQFNTITTNHKITVVCTAYAKNLQDKMYSTEFTFHIV